MSSIFESMAGFAPANMVLQTIILLLDYMLLGVRVYP